MNTLTIIQNEDQTLSLKVEGDMSYDTLLLMLCSTIKQASISQANAIASRIHKESPKTKLKDIREEVKGDMADRINYLISNILNELSPRDPDLQLSEQAIVTLENIIIDRAAAEHISIEEALHLVQDELSHNPLAADYSSRPLPS